MSPACPSCNSPLDPTHAPVARIRGAKVVTYCSTSCANNAQTEAVGKKPETSSAAEAKSKPSQTKKAAPKEPAAKTAPAAKTTTPSAKTTTPAAKTATPAAKTAPSAKTATPSAKTTPAAKADPAAKVAAKTAPSAPAGRAPEPELLAPISETRRGLSDRARGIVLWASVAIMIVGGAVLFQALRSREPTPATDTVGVGKTVEDAAAAAARRDLATPDPERPSKPAQASPAQIRARAIAELEEHLRDGSTRFQRLAGIALARDAHAGAVAVLSGLLETERSDLSRIDVAYGLALAGREEGRAYLVNELDSRRRDVRIDAARRLVQLKDDAGRKALLRMLGVRSHRLGAASVLALLGDEKGLEVLRKTLEDRRTSEENRMRAAVGLGRAGDDRAREFLEHILEEGRYVVDAAGALAALGDESAIPALERQLELTAMRVRAAESLVLMGHDVDLSLMTAALETDNEEGRIAAAEAILVLTSDESADD